MTVTACQAVDRALRLLELFDEWRPAWNATEAAAALGVHRTTGAVLLAHQERGMEEPR